MNKLSIITATYNSSDFISYCIESVLYQNLSVEHIVIDGASTDNTLSILDNYKNNLKRIISEPDRGTYDGLNKGIKLATGGIIGILHADDFYPNEDILKKVIKVFKDTDIDACYGDLNYVRQDNSSKVVRKWKSGDFDPDKFYWGWMPPHPTFFVRRLIYDKYGLFSLEMGTAADYELMLRFLLKHKIKTVYIPEALVHMRTGGVSNSSVMNRIRANKMDRKAWEVNGLKPYPWTTWLKPIRKISQWFV